MPDWRCRDTDRGAAWTVSPGVWSQKLAISARDTDGKAQLSVSHEI